MKAKLCLSRNILYFSRWCRKGYAIFAALGKEVHISALAISICMKSLQKSARKGVIVNMATCWQKEIFKIFAVQQKVEYIISGLRAGEVCPAVFQNIVSRKGYAEEYALFI